MAIYVKMDGVKGDVTAEGFPDHMEVSSLQWGVGRGIGSPLGGSKDREASAPSVSEVVLTKVMDQSSPQLLREALWGEGKKVEIKLVKTDKDKLEIYAQYILEEALLSGYSVSSGGDRPTESLSLNFTKVEFNNTGMGPKNETGDPDRVQYDLAKAKGA
jgi:type VI secretion system secreted protein Hcp